MRLAITGSSGFVGRFIVEDALASGDEVLALSRRAPVVGAFSCPVKHVPFDLDAPPPALEGVDAVVHLAFSHLPGRYRGGEGNDPDGFLQRNLDGTRRLFEAAHRAGVRRVVFLSSRAVYGGFPPGTSLSEDLPPRPDTLYGRVKLEAEQALETLIGSSLTGVSLRATGVYGPAGKGQLQKWQGLFNAFLRGEVIAPRVASEVHGVDLAAAVRLVLTAGTAPPAVLNVSDLLLDRHDLLAAVTDLTGQVGLLPRRADARTVSVMTTDSLRKLGWRPRGMHLLRTSLPEMLRQAR